MSDIAKCPDDLHRFFDEFMPYLRGDIDVRTYRGQAGPSPSISEGFEYYPFAAAKNPRDVLESIFRATHVAVDAHCPGMFEKLMVKRLAAGRPVHLARVITGFSEIVGQAVTAGELPALCAELADYEELWLHLRTGPAAPAAPGLAPMLEVRRYTYNVVALFKAAREGPAAEPEAGESVYILFRHPETARARRHQPTLPQLMALAVRSGEAPRSAVLESGVTEAELSAAESELRARGVFV